MYSVGRSDPALSSVLSKIAGIAADPPPPTPEEIGKLVDDVIAKGSAERGERIFRRKDLSCMKCHSVSRAGGQVGPELSAVGGSSPVDYIVNSILNPNLAVKEQYVTRVFALDSGKVVTGVVLDRDDVRVNVRDVTGATITIPTADIDEEAEGKSLMPQGLTKFLTRDELLDLARFVSELGKSGAYAVYQGKTIQRWRMLAQPPMELTAEVPHLEHFRQYVVGAEPTSWIPVYAMVGGTLPLGELRAGTEPTVLFLKGEFDVRTAGKVAITVKTTETFQAWVDAEPAPPGQPILVELPPGRHAVTLRVEVSDRPQPELRVEIAAPDDSSAKYEIVGGQ
jgi:putative heme-binding domain-containing protein